MRRTLVMLLAWCPLAVAACGAFGADDPEGTDAGTDAAGDGSVVDGALGDGHAIPDGAQSEGGACPHLRCLTFEDGFTGFDKATGAPAHTTENAPKGRAALRVGGSQSYVTIEHGDQSELWVSFYVRIDSSGVDATPFEIKSSDGATLLRGSTSTTTFTVFTSLQPHIMSAAITLGTVYRCGLHLKQSGAGNGLSIEGFFAAGDAPFGSFKFASTENLNLRIPSALHIGSVGAPQLEAVFDDVFVSVAAMPPPSP